MRILFLRTLLGGFLCALFSAPLLVSAQATTTAEQPVTADAVFNQALNQFTSDRSNLIIPKLESLASDTIGGLMDVKISPSNPGPKEKIQVSIESYLSDLNKASISWSLNDVIALKGVGKKSFSFQNGSSGKTTKLTISILTNKGESITKEYSWTPVGVTLLWEANTYTPPFYRGKALISPQAQVRAIAIPDTTGTPNALSSGNLVYVWRKNGLSSPDISGYGKNVFSFTGPQPYDELAISVLASSINNTIISEARANIPLSSPFILFYEKDPLLGVLYNHPLFGSFTLSKKEVSLNAEPYFFSNEPKEGSATPTLSYLWSINGENTSNEGRTITLRNDTGVAGASVVSLAMHGLRQTFQSASRALQINFTESPTSSRPTF